MEAMNHVGCAFCSRRYGSSDSDTKNNNNRDPIVCFLEFAGALPFMHCIYCETSPDNLGDMSRPPALQGNYPFTSCRSLLQRTRDQCCSLEGYPRCMARTPLMKRSAQPQIG